MKITFLKTGDVTWVSKSGRREKRRHITAGTVLYLQAKQQGNDWEIWDGYWSILMPGDAVRVEKTRKKTKRELWCFAQSELSDPSQCKRSDEFLASATTGPDSSVGVIVYRNGKASNRFADGVAGIGKELAELAEADEELYHPELDEVADVWKYVLTDDAGDWLGWAKQ